MKLRSVRYLSKEGIKNMWSNRLMTIASVGVLVACMVLIGLAVLISLNLDRALSNLEQQNVVRVFFNDKTSVIYGNSADKYNPSSSQESSSDSSQEGSSSETSSITGQDALKNPDDIPEDAYLIHNEMEALELCEKLEDIDNVLSVEFVSSDSALQTLQDNEQLPNEYIEHFDFKDEYGNPLPCGAIITLEDMSLFSETLKELEATEGIDAIQSQADLADKINALKNGIGIAGIWIISILLIISLVIVSNTIRVTMYSRKLEIGIMKAVGATNSFIRLPFIIEGVMIGLVSAILSMGILYFCYRVAIEAIADALTLAGTVSFMTAALQIFVLFVLIGTLSGVLGSVIMIRKYLRKEGSEFTAI